MPHSINANASAYDLNNIIYVYLKRFCDEKLSETHCICVMVFIYALVICCFLGVCRFYPTAILGIYPIFNYFIDYLDYLEMLTTFSSAIPIVTYLANHSFFFIEYLHGHALRSHQDAPQTWGYLTFHTFFIDTLI